MAAVTLSNDALVRRFNSKTGFGLAKSHETINALCEVLTDALSEGYHIKLQKLGTFKLHRKDARVARVPSTGAEVNVPEHTVVKFTPVPYVRDLLYNVEISK